MRANVALIIGFFYSQRLLTLSQFRAGNYILKTKILITGASGLLGTHAIAAMGNDYHIHAIVRSLPKVPIDGVEYCIVDFSNRWSIQELPDEIDSIIHLAQSSHYRNFPVMAPDIFNVNIESTARLLDYAYQVGVKSFIYASSGGVYGSGNRAFDEETQILQPQQLGYYLGSKLCSEILTQNYSKLMNVVILRFFFMYGPGQTRSMLIPRLIDNIQAGRPITLQGENGLRINPVHVSDSVKVIEKALGLEKSCTINVGGPEILSLRQIGNIIEKQLGTMAIYDVSAGDPQDIIGNIAYLKACLWSPQICLKDGIREILPEYR